MCGCLCRTSPLDTRGNSFVLLMADKNRPHKVHNNLPLRMVEPSLQDSNRKRQ